jgi:subfamily B ATP-binding cassette protein HlyB/CyaB
MSAGSQRIVWLLGSLCRVHQIPFDAQWLLRHFPPPLTELTLLEAARGLGLRIAEAKFDPASVSKLAMPCVAFEREAATSGTATGAEPSPQSSQAGRGHPVLVVGVERGQALYFVPGESEAKRVSADELAQRFTGRCLLVSRVPDESAQSAGGDDLDATERPEVQPTPEMRGFGFAWFARELLAHKAVWRQVLVASLVIQLVGLATPLFTQVIIDKVVVHRTGSTLAVIAAGLVMFLLFSAGMTWLRQYLVIDTGNRVDAVLGSKAFRHLLRLPLPYFEARPTGTLVARLQTLESVREFLSGAVVVLLLDLPFLVLFAAAMAYYSWQLSLVVFFMLALIVVVSAIVTPLFRSRLNRQFQLGARNQAFLTEHVAGMETVKSLQMEPNLESRFDENLAAYLAAGFSTRQLGNTYGTIAGALEQALMLLVLCLGALLVMDAVGFTIGMLVAFQMFASRISQPLLKLAGLWQQFQQSIVAVRRLGDLMNAPAEPWSLKPGRVSEGAAAIRIEGLSYRYDRDTGPLFEDLSLDMTAGELVVVKGVSGSGKSTLAKLILGFYVPSGGRILIDGRDARHSSANELRGHFGVVPQDTRLFSGSVYENLVAANPHAGFPEVVRACRIAEVHEAIEALPHGYNTRLGEQGVGLSGGQKQRIAIARALLKQPRALIFDEATSNLDPQTAERFADTINRLKGKVTILFIAHQVPASLSVDATYEMNRWQPGVPAALALAEDGGQAGQACTR